MKHFSTLLFLTVLLLSGITAKASVNFELIIDHPEYVKVSVDWNEVSVVQGCNQMSVEDYANFSIETRDYNKHIIQEVLIDNEFISKGSFYRNQYNITELNGTTIEVRSCLVDDLRTGSFTVIVDNPGRLSYVSTNGSPQTTINIKELEAGIPYTVKYIPDVNTTIQFNASGAPIYQIYKNDQPVTTDNYGNYNIEIENNMMLNVKCNYPDAMSTLTFNYEGDAAQLFNRLYIYGDASNNYAKTDVEVINNTAQVPIGSQIVIEHKIDYANYILDSYTVGEKSTSSLSQTFQTYITQENVPVNISAHLSNPVNVTFDITGAEGIVVNRKEPNDILTLANGMNNPTLYSSNLELTIKSYPNYEITSVKLNGQEQEKTWSGDYRFYAYNDMIHDGDVIKIEAAPKSTFKAYLTVEDASLVILKRNYSSWSEELIPLHNGRNEIICTEGTNEFYITPSATGYISSVNLNFDEEVSREYYGGFRFTVESDYEVMVSAEPIVNEGDMILYIDNMEYRDVSSFNWSNTLIRDNDTSLVTGYNNIPFFHGCNPYKVSCYYVYGSDVTFALYLNDQKIEMPYPNYPSTDLSLAPGDIIKIYLANAEPEFYEVTFTEDTTEGSFSNVTYDMIRKVTDVNTPVNVLSGTIFNFTVDSESNMLVEVNNEEIKPDDEGKYQVAIHENTDITLKKSASVGISSVMEDTMNTYFTIDGIRLNERPTKPGIYIEVKNNKTGKIMVR